MPEREESVGHFEMLWDCDHCETKGLLAKSQRHCPECGAPQSAIKRYFPKPEEQRPVDGHVYEGSDRHCPACNAPMSAKGTHCTQCGSPLDGSKTYKIHLPPNIPAKEFWSFVVYDNQTRSMLQTDQQFPSIGSDKKDIVINADGSVDVWFGPTAPEGHEANWVQTVPGKGWNVLLRLYGPLESWFDKSWKPGEFELVN